MKLDSFRTGWICSAEKSYPMRLPNIELMNKSDEIDPVSLSIWGYRAWHPAFLVVGCYWFLGVFLSLIIPPNIVDSRAWAAEFTKLMVSVVPSIRAFAETSSFPEVSTFFLSVMWCAVAFTAFVFYRFYSTTSFHPAEFSRAASLLTAMSATRLGLVVVGPLMMAAISLWLLLLCTAIRQFVVVPMMRKLAARENNQ